MDSARKGTELLKKSLGEANNAQETVEEFRILVEQFSSVNLFTKET